MTRVLAPGRPVMGAVGHPSENPDPGVSVVEDAAQAHGAVRGSRSAAVCYSFHPTKNPGGVGDGGAVVTDDAEVASELRLLRGHGIGPDCVRVANREGFRRRLGVPSEVHYPRAVHDQPAFGTFVRRRCPEAREWAAECVSLPCNPYMTDGEVETVAAALARTAGR